jgi:hypothetical protein
MAPELKIKISTETELSALKASEESSSKRRTRRFISQKGKPPEQYPNYEE